MGLTYSSVVDASVDEVFSWHARPGAITRLAPPWPPVRVIREVSGSAVAPGRPGGARPARRAALGRRPPAGRLPPAVRVRRLAGIPPAVRGAAVAAHPRVQPGGRGGHAGDRRGRHPAARPGAPVHVRLPAPAARRRPGRAGPGSRDLPGHLDDSGHRLGRPDRHRPDGAADHQRAPGHPAGAPAAPARGGALLAARRPEPAAAGRGRRGDPPGRGLDRRPVHPGTQERDPATAGSCRPACWPSWPPLPRPGARRACGRSWWRRPSASTARIGARRS